MSEKIQWEYHIEILGSTFRSPKPVQVEDFLNQVGEEGWEVVNLHQPQNSNKVWIIMKRGLTVSTRRSRSRPGGSW